MTLDWTPKSNGQATVIGVNKDGLARLVSEVRISFVSARSIRAGGFDFKLEPVRPGVYETWDRRTLLVGPDSAHASLARQQVELGHSIGRVRQIGRQLTGMRISTTMVGELRELVSELQSISSRGVVREAVDEEDCRKSLGL